jgi:hypothetical protein
VSKKEVIEDKAREETTCRISPNDDWSFPKSDGNSLGTLNRALIRTDYLFHCYKLPPLVSLLSFSAIFIKRRFFMIVDFMG